MDNKTIVKRLRKIANEIEADTFTFDNIMDLITDIKEGESKTYEQRVQEYEAQGMTRSDAQGVVDAENIRQKEDESTQNECEACGANEGKECSPDCQYSDIK